MATGGPISPEPLEDVAPELAGGRRLRTFDSLIDVPAFRWYLLSMTGNWSALQMQQVARGFLAYQLTDSFVALGLVELGNSLPRVVLALYGGVVADRASRRVILQIGQGFNAALSIVLAAMLFADVLRFEHLVIAAVAQGAVNSFALPARQAMIPEIVGRSRLMNAFALNVFALNMMRLVAPALAGGIIATVGPAWVFTVMCVLNVLAVAAMFPVPLTNAATRAALAQEGMGLPGGDAPASKSGLQDIRDAFRYLGGQHLLMILLGLQGLTSMLALPYQRLLPGFVDEVLSSGPEQTAVLMGLLLTFTAVGALVGSLLIASLPNRGRGRLLIASLVIFGVALLGFAISEWFWISAAAALVLGIGQAGRQSLVNILIQSNVAESFRGRITSILLLEDGVESLGIFGIALLAEVLGPQAALGAVAVALLVLSLALWATRRIRLLE